MASDDPRSSAAKSRGNALSRFWARTTSFTKRPRRSFRLGCCRCLRAAQRPAKVDGSDHHWFEERGPRCVLLVYVDDATSTLMALRMCESESAFSYFYATRSYLERHRKPVALYSDKAGVFRVNAKRPNADDGPTQFGRAMSDLNIDVICANTPAAKGRVERAHQTLRGRVVARHMTKSERGQSAGYPSC